MREVVFLLEEDNARVLLEKVFALLVPEDSGVRARFIVFEGKQDLDRQLPRKLRGYLNPHARFIVMRDQDKEDCRTVKQSLRTLCNSAGKPEVTIRIACRELEAFYLGDLLAVEKGLKIGKLAAKQRVAKFRNPDSLQSPAHELEMLTNLKYQKVSGARAIAPHLNLDTPKSQSFHHLLQAIRSAAQLGNQNTSA
jgi:hypothetical protein